MFIKGNSSDAIKILGLTVSLAVVIWGVHIDNITIALFGFGLFFLIGLLIILLKKLNFLD